jgi:hypothetical protein
VAYGLINVIDSWRNDEQYYQIVQKAYLVHMASEGRGYVHVKIGDNDKLYIGTFLYLTSVTSPALTTTFSKVRASDTTTL